MQKLRSARGLTRAGALLLTLIGIMLVIIAIPVVRYYLDQAERIGCRTSLDKAQRELTIDSVLEFYGASDEGVDEFLARTAEGWSELCPAGGTTYVVKNADPKDPGHPYRVVCGLHDTDKRERTRINAYHALELLRDAVYEQQLGGTDVPASAAVRLNSRDLTAQLAREDPGLRRGTGTTPDVEGTVLYYGLSGEGPLGRDSFLRGGSVCYFVYADEDYCAIWRSGEGWSGDAYQ